GRRWCAAGGGDGPPPGRRAPAAQRRRPGGKSESAMTDVRPTAAAPEPGEGAPAANIVVIGAAGRMGSRIVALHREAGLRLAAALEAPGHRALGRDAGELAGAGLPRV